MTPHPTTSSDTSVCPGSTGRLTCTLIASALPSKEAMHAQLMQDLHFPDYYGHNLDALADCLSSSPAHQPIHITLVNDLDGQALPEWLTRAATVMHACSQSLDHVFFSEKTVPPGTTGASKDLQNQSGSASEAAPASTQAPAVQTDPQAGHPQAPAQSSTTANALPRRAWAWGLIRHNLPVLIALICLAAVCFFARDVLAGESIKIDLLARTTIVEGMRSDALTPIMQMLSDLATPFVLIMILLIMGAFAPGKRPGWCAGVNLLGAWGLNLLLKALVQRPRPFGIALIEETGFSFPSGHSMVSMAFYGFIVWMIWHYNRDKLERYFICTVVSLTIVGIGFSRIYLGVHYASDVLSGFCISLIWLICYTRFVAPLFLDTLRVRPDDAFPPPDAQTLDAFAAHTARQG